MNEELYCWRVKLQKNKKNSNDLLCEVPALIFWFLLHKVYFQKKCKENEKWFYKMQERNVSYIFCKVFLYKHLNVSASVHSVTLDKKRENMK